jgi:membrane-bound lytic murein transglycosylase B
VSLQRDVNILGSKISQSQAKIKAQSIKINNISGDITEKVGTIKELTYKTDQQKKALAQVLRKKNELDGASFVEFALSQKTLSDFFGDEDSYVAVQAAISDSYNQLTSTKKETEKVKETLEGQKDEELTLRELQQIEKKKTEQAQALKAQILKQTKGQEAAYKKVLTEREKDASKIRSALFALLDGSSIQFGTLYDYAKRAGSATGVRPAFIMAIMSQETNLGANTGTCYLKDVGGTLVSISSGASRGEMRPNSIQPFLSITQAVGRDTYKTKVSCAYQGWGGAMGIAQFMPATWMSYKKRIESATGAAYADPWNNFHAVTAIGIYMKDLGASAQTDEAERNAACKYYSGRSCASGPGSAYGNSVLRKEADIQAKIDQLQIN